MKWYEVEDNLWFLLGMFIGCLCFGSWVLAALILMLPEIVAIQYGIPTAPMTLGRLVVSLLLFITGLIFYRILKKMGDL